MNQTPTKCPHCNSVQTPEEIQDGMCYDCQNGYDSAPEEDGFFIENPLNTGVF